MPAFDPAEATSGGMDWALLQASHVHLYWRVSVLDQAVEWFRGRGYEVVELDAAPWKTEADMHDAVAQAFGFPDYYGRNLNALDDCLHDVALYEYGASPQAAGTVIVLTHFDSLAHDDMDHAHTVLDIFAVAARTGMLIGHRMLILVQSDDPNISLEPIGARRVMWNPQEWLKARREQPRG